MIADVLKYIVKIEDIKDIVIATFPKETTYYVIIDPYNTKYDGGSKKSFIRIEKNENNLKFIKQFWDKPIKKLTQTCRSMIVYSDGCTFL